MSELTRFDLNDRGYENYIERRKDGDYVLFDDAEKIIKQLEAQVTQLKTLVDNLESSNAELVRDKERLDYTLKYVTNWVLTESDIWQMYSVFLSKVFKGKTQTECIDQAIEALKLRESDK